MDMFCLTTVILSLAVLVARGSNASGSNPTGTLGLTTWSGVMVRGNQKQAFKGKAEAIVNLPSASVSIFGEIKNLDTGDYIENMKWHSIPLTDGAFRSATGGWIRGAFYGSGHEKIVGNFDRDNIVGAFSAMRQVQ